MANVFIVENTAGTLSITLQPGALNGPGSVQRDTDMRLYGMGALLWGEGMDENILRLTETFACPDKGALGSPVTILGIPQDETDLGPGKGITVPIIGQLWYNTTNNTVYSYNGAGWGISVDISGKVDRIGDTMTGVLQINAYGNLPPHSGDPTVPGQGNFGLFVDTQASADAGGILLKTGDNNGDEHAIEVLNYLDERVFSLRSTDGDIDFYGTFQAQPNASVMLDHDPTLALEAATKQYVDNGLGSGSAGLAAHTGDTAAHITANQNTFLDTIESTCANSPAAAAGLAADLCALDGFAGGSGGVWDEIDDKLNLTGGSMTGYLTLIHPPTSNTHAATKLYVDQAVAAAIDIGSADRFVRYFSGTGSGVLNGDIRTSGTTIYIYAGGWRQVYPAIYS